MNFGESCMDQYGTLRKLEVHAWTIGHEPVANFMLSKYIFGKAFQCFPIYKVFRTKLVRIMRGCCPKREIDDQRHRGEGDHYLY